MKKIVQNKITSWLGVVFLLLGAGFMIYGFVKEMEVLYTVGFALGAILIGLFLMMAKDPKWLKAIFNGILKSKNIEINEN
jgi:uncharacterized membrane protein YciS (DUF1049 family)